MAKMLHRLYRADNAAASHRALVVHQARQQVANQRHMAFVRAPERPVRPERLGVVGVDALPAERLLQSGAKVNWTNRSSLLMSVSAISGYAIPFQLAAILTNRYFCYRHPIAIPVETPHCRAEIEAGEKWDG